MTLNDHCANFVHLHVHSAYSLAEGALKIPDLIRLTKADKMPAVAVTDTNNMFGALEFATAAAKEGVQPIIGAQLACGPEKHQLVLLVQSEQGYRNLCKLISDAYLEHEKETYVDWDELGALNEGLICLTGGTAGPINQYLLHNQNKEAAAFLKKLKGWFGDRLYIELQRHEGWRDEERTEEPLIDLAYKHNIALVATNDCYFAERSGHEAHDALLCIADGRYITEDDRRKVTPDHYYKSPREMEELFADIPEAIQNTAIIAQRCGFLLEPISPILPPFDTKGDRTEVEELRAQAEDGLKWRLENFVIPKLSSRPQSEQGSDIVEGSSDTSRISDPSASDADAPFARDDMEDAIKPYKERLDFELKVIENMGFPGYFLIVSDFIKWAKEQNIPVGPGRGSGAGSVVAWALKITDLDPLELGLLFERFLNPERVSMPDFDIDFCQERRDEVIRYVQDKYGYDHVAQIITFGKLQARAVVRDVGRVLQMPYGQVDRIAKMIPNNPAAPMTLEEALAADDELRKVRDQDDTSKKLINVALQLEGLYRHASTHAAGVVIGDRPLHELVPLYRDPRSDMPVTQFNMKYVESAGLVKFDFLGLKTMTVVQKTVEMVNEKAGDSPIDLLKIPLDDPGAYKLMASGNTVGVFQLESAGMRDTLRRVKPNRFEDIIALVSLYRPGPMENIPKYAAVKEGKEEPDYMHPKLQQYLEETYGIMIYQEQVMQAAQELAGYTLGGADLLRRAMGKKIQSEMDEQREMFVTGANDNNNVPADQANYIFDQIAAFAGYGFNKSHAAAYALIAYWTAWLKANHPYEFMAASMTLDLGNVEKLAVFKQDLDKMNMDLLPPDVNKSHPIFAVEDVQGDNAIRYALGALKGVGAAAMGCLVAERESNGAYKDLNDFAERLDPKNMNKRQFEQMTCAGAFDSLHDNRAQICAASETILRYAHSLAEERESGQVSLFGGEGGGGEKLGLPELPDLRPWEPLEQLSREFGAVGFYLSAHPLDTRLDQFERLGIKNYLQVEQAMLHTPAMSVQMAGVILKKQERVSAKSGNKFAFVQLSDPSGIYEVMLFSDILNATRDILEPGNSILLKASAESREDQISFKAEKIQILDDALESKIQSVTIHADSAAFVHKLKEFLDIEGAGRSQIHLYLTLQDGREVQMNVPGSWSLSAQARNQIRIEDGVKQILES